MSQSIWRFVCYSVLVISLLAPGLGSPVLGQSDARAVVATGVGADERSALQNAAENALTEVAGTFVRSDTNIERNVEIKGALRSETRRIDTRVSEYAQGTISSIRILTTEPLGSSVKVTAEISVRVGELREFVAFIQTPSVPIASEVKINSQLNKRRETSAEDIFLDTVLQPILLGTAVRFELGQPQPVSAIKRSSQDMPLGLDRLPTSAVILPIKVSIDAAYQANASAALQAIGRKMRGCGAGSSVTYEMPSFAFNTVAERACYRIDDFSVFRGNDLDGEYDCGEGDTVCERSARSDWKVNFGLINPSLRNYDVLESTLLSVEFKDRNGNVIHRIEPKGCQEYFSDIEQEDGGYIVSHSASGVDRIKCFMPLFDPDFSYSNFNTSSWTVTDRKVIYLVVDGTSNWFQNADLISIKLKGMPVWE